MSAKLLSMKPSGNCQKQLKSQVSFVSVFSQDFFKTKGICWSYILFSSKKRFSESQIDIYFKLRLVKSII